MKIELSIIIPAYNEEKNISILLKSIKQQKLNNYEIIVADADSNDDTAKIAKNSGCKIVLGGLPAKGRNNGSKEAKGEILLFLDADTRLPKNFLKKNLKEFEKRKLDLAGVKILPNSKKKIDYLSYGAYNLWQKAMQKIDPHLSGCCIFIKKNVFFKLKGFDEDLIVAEDHALARKAHKNKYNFGILSEKIVVSTRRLEKEGRIKVLSKLVFFWFRRLFKEIKKSNVKYELKNR